VVESALETIGRAANAPAEVADLTNRRRVILFVFGIIVSPFTQIVGAAARFSTSRPKKLFNDHRLLVECTSPTPR